MRRKNLEKAIIMSLVLMGLNNSCQAADAMTSSEFEQKYADKDSNSYIVTENVKVENDSRAQIGGNKPEDKKFNTIEIQNGATLTLENVYFGYKPTITGNGNITINLTDMPVENEANHVFKTGADITANSLTVINSSKYGDAKGMAAEENSIKINAKYIEIYGNDDGIYQSTKGNSGIAIKNFDTLKITGKNGYGIVGNNHETVEIIGNEGSTAYFESMDGSEDDGRAAVGNRYGSGVNVEAGTIELKGNRKGVYAMKGFVTLNANKNVSGDNIIDVRAVYDAVYSDGGKINLKADTNIVVGGRHGIVAELNDSAIDITGNMNIIGANSNTGELLRSLNEDKKLIYGDQTVIWAAQVAEDEGKIDDKDRKENPELNVNISAETENLISGAIRAENDSIVTVQTTGNAEGGNYILSSAHGKDNEHIVAAVYAKDNATINIKAGENGENYIATDFKFQTGDEHDKDSERTIWAQQGGKINIEGQTTIVNSNPNANTNGTPGNSYGIAVTAGTGDTDFNNITDFNIDDAERSTVKISYLDGTDKDGNTAKSSITGDIVSGYGGLINIQALDSLSKANSTSGLIVKGNALAANGGKLNLDIGNGGVWTGRADDYGDAGVVKDGKHTTFFHPAFSNTIVQGGQVNLTMGEGSRWNVTGQSWITSINTGNSDIAAGTPIIDLVNANTDRNTTAHALTIYNLNGNAIFNMSLNGDRDVSDMLYIKNAEGEYVINVVDSVSVDDMYQDGFDGLRFATIGDGSNVSFRAITYNQGINNVEYEVGQDAYNKENSEENDAYNSSSDETDGGMNSEKPGSDMVEDFFDSTGTPENPQGPDDTEIMTLENTVENDSNVNGTTNFKLIGVKDSEISDGGKTVVNMSKVNYSNAVYMDRLNKRLGEARYINTEEDQGMWVRMRHDRIGKDNEFRIMNTMYELGYDEKQECDNGERRIGAAIDYMDGSSEYTGVGGSGDVSRKGIWLYDTWLGDKGHYSDFVAKWGHLSNDFTLYRDGNKITGDFSNNVYSISAEYGRKKDIGNNWYFEPQVQLQYARVTDANYTTSQGTEVSLDAINSLIARAGFRLGKDLGERSTVYFKADLLHEFLGDQDIYAHDKTGTMDVTYGNEGTWCDIGFGFATAMSKTSYAYLDVETSLGNDYEETYQINAGLQWSF